MGFKSPKIPAAPTPPDPIATAQAQGQANVDTARVNFMNSAVNQYTPSGSLEWHNWAPDRWSAVQTLSGPQQHLFDINQATDIEMAQHGRNQVARVGQALAQPFDPNSTLFGGYSVRSQYVDPANNPVGNMRTDTRYLDTPAGSEEWAGPAQTEDTQRIANLMQQREAPRMQAQREALRTQLVNQGVREGSEAWNRSMADYGRQANDFAIAAQLAAGQEQSRLYGLGADQARFQNLTRQAQLGEREQILGQQTMQDELFNQRRAQAIDEEYRRAQTQMQTDDRWHNYRDRAIQEALLTRQTPINETTALMSGSQVAMPNFVNTPTFNSQPAPYAQSAYQTAGLQQGNYAAQLAAAQQAQAANRAGMFGLLGQGLGAGAFMFGASDERLKTDIEQVGILPSGIGVYRFRYKWDAPGVAHIGVIAQEAAKVFPDTVGRVGEYLMVFYSRLLNREFAND